VLNNMPDDTSTDMTPLEWLTALESIGSVVQCTD
jgi:hypothetical protein